MNSTASAEQMTRQLHDVGLSITIEAVPASPQLVGRWLVAAATDDVPGAVYDDLSQQAIGKTATLEVIRTFPGDITLTVGRSPHAGEDLQVSGAPNALAPGGLIYCQRLSGQDPAVAAQSLTDAGYTVRWGLGGARRAVSAAPKDTRVVQAYINDDPSLAPKGVAADPKTVQLIALATADAGYQQLLWTGYPLSAHVSGKRDYRTCPSP